MWDWASKIDPNVALALLTGIGAWVYHRIRGDQQENFSDMLRGVGKQVIHEALTDGALDSENVDRVRLFVEAKFWELAAKADIPRNSTTEGLARAVIEHSIGDVLDELRAAAALPGKLAELAATAAAGPAMFDKAEAEGRARVAGMKDLIETVK